MKRIAHWFLVLGFVAILLISGCAAPKVPAPASAPEKAAAPAASKAELTREQKLVSAAKEAGEKEVVLWTFGWSLGPMEKAFEAKYPFLKLKIWVGNAVDATVLAEYKAGKHNVDVLMQPVRRLVRLREAGTLQEYDFPNTVGWPYQPGHNFWRHQEVTLRVPLYNTNLVSAKDAPKSWNELKDTKWRGQTMLSTSAADWPLTFAWLLGDVTEGEVKWERTLSFWKELVQNTRPTIGSGWEGPTQLLVAGDLSLMPLASSGTALQLIWKGAPIDFASTEQVSGSTNGYGLAKHPPHPNAAQLLMDFLTSPEGSLVRADETGGGVTLDPKAAQKSKNNLYFSKLGIKWQPMPPELQKEEWVSKSEALWLTEILGRR